MSAAVPAQSVDRAWTIGVDMGGTFVDCVVAGPTGEIAEAKAPTTPDEPELGIVAAIRSAAGSAGMTVEELLAGAGTLVHGTTAGLNMLLTGAGGRVGLLATRGHEDAILIGRVHQKVAGLRLSEMISVADLRKPAPLVPRWDIRGIDERVDAAGHVIVPLDEAAVLAAARQLVDDGCEAIAITFLWSHVRPDHERRAAELIREACRDIPVVCSCAIAPVLGEYERTAATVVNAVLLTRTSGYLDRLGQALRERGFAGRLWVMGMTGGVVPDEVARLRPVDTLRSGPVGGVMAAAHVGRRSGRNALISADMGGTSFDVGLLPDGEPEQSDVTLVGRFHLATPSISVSSIGAGGGSIAWLDEFGELHVGPRSAGSEPGPACYGRGGTEPTVTDADLILGRLGAAGPLGGQIRLDLAAAERAFAPLARELRVDVVEIAAGAVRIADARMADLIRTATLERGHDPRDFTLVAFGGAGPLHVGGFAADVGVREAVVPRSASVLSASGLATADYRRTYRRTERTRLPLDASRIAVMYAELRTAAEADFTASRFGGRLVLAPWVDLRYSRQTHQLRVPIDVAAMDRLDSAALRAAFERQYARTFGDGTGYAAAGIEATSVGLYAGAERSRLGDRGASRSPAPAHVAPPPPAHVEPAAAASRRVWFDGGWVDTRIVPVASLARGAGLDGPAIVDWGHTSLVVHPGQRVTLDASLSAWIRFSREVAP